VGKFGLDAALLGHGPQFGAEFAFIAAHDLRTAVGDDGPRHAFHLTPRQLRVDWDVADQRVVVFAYERAGQGRAVADANVIWRRYIRGCLKIQVSYTGSSPR